MRRNYFDLIILADVSDHFGASHQISQQRLLSAWGAAIWRTLHKTEVFLGWVERQKSIKIKWLTIKNLVICLSNLEKVQVAKLKNIYSKSGYRWYIQFIWNYISMYKCICNKYTQVFNNSKDLNTISTNRTWWMLERNVTYTNFLDNIQPSQITH